MVWQNLLTVDKFILCHSMYHQMHNCEMCFENVFIIMASNIREFKNRQIFSKLIFYINKIIK